MQKIMTKPSPASAIHKCLMRFRQLHPDMTVLQASMFLVVAIHPGITQSQAGKMIGMDGSTASRTLAILSDIGGRGSVPPLNLVQVEVSLEDRRERVLHLTKKGERLLSEMTKYLCE